MYLFTKEDRVPVKIGDVTFWIAPLDNDERAEISTAVTNQGGTKRVDVKKLYQLYLKYAVKRIDGVKMPNGKPWKIKFTKTGHLTEDSLDKLLTLACAPQLAQVALDLFTEIKESKIEGVEVDIKGTIPEKKLESLSQ